MKIETLPLSVLNDWGPRWDDAVAIAAKQVGATGVLRRWGESDYQGSATVVLYKEDTDQFLYYEWSWGSCSGCDGWEADGYSSYAESEDLKLEGLARREIAPQMHWMDRIDFVCLLKNDIAKSDGYGGWAAPGWGSREEGKTRMEELLAEIAS